jgi:hypothetical protein
MTGDFLTRIERRALLFVGIAGLATVAVPGLGLPVAAGIAGGAFLSGVSYWAIKRGVGGLAGAMAGGAGSRPSAARALIMLVGRYALLALIAYVMIARLRLSPLGLLLGASVIPAAASVEALAALRKN